MGDPVAKYLQAEAFQNESLDLQEFKKYYQDEADEGVPSSIKKTASVAAFIFPFSLITRP